MGVGLARFSFAPGCGGVIAAGPVVARTTSLWLLAGPRSLRATRSRSFPRKRLSPSLPGPMPKTSSRSALTFFSKPKLLIVDEFGYLPFEPNVAHLFFQLVSRRYERAGSMLIELQPRGWRMGPGPRRSRRCYSDPRPAASSQPRHHHRGDSYRLREADAVAFCRRPLRQRLKPKLPNRGVQFSMTKRVQFRMSFDTAHFS